MDLSELYKAAKSCNWKFINTKLVSTGSEAGYTALHFAAMKKSEVYVLELIKNKAEINSFGYNLAQPIHLACLLNNVVIADILLSSGANPNAELNNHLLFQYDNPQKGCHEFNDKMPLLAFAVLNNRQELFECLLRHQANVWIRTTKNKTLLMIAIENDFHVLANLLVSKMKNHHEFINAQDSRGRQAIHYFAPNKRFGFDEYRIIDQRQDLLKNFVRWGDINVAINGKPATMIINMAAYRWREDILKVLLIPNLPLNPQSKALYYASLPVNLPKPRQGLNRYLAEFQEEMMELMKPRRQTLKCILGDMRFRREFGFFVPPEEILLMDKLVAENNEVQRIVRSYENDFIKGVLKTKVVKFGRQSMILYDLMVNVINGKKLKLLVKSNRFIRARGNFFAHRDINSLQLDPIIEFIDQKVGNFIIRRNLEDRVQEIENLRKALPLPYELVLDILEFVDNNGLENFIAAFY